MRLSRRAVGGNNAEAGLQSRKRIIGNFRTRRGNARDQRGFARVRKSDQAHIRQQLQFQVQIALLTRLAFFGFARRLMPGLGEMLIAAPAASALRDQDALAGLGQVGDLFAGILIGDNRADRDGQNHVRAGMSGAIGTFAVASAIGFEFAIVAIAQQGVVVRIGFQINAAAMAAVAAGRPAARHEFLAAERDAAVPAVAGLHIDFGFVDEHHGSLPPFNSIRQCRDRSCTPVAHTSACAVIALQIHQNPQAEVCAY